MLFFSALTSLFGGRGSDTQNGTALCLIDTRSMFRKNGSRASASPGDQLDLLRRLSRFSSKEKIKTVAFLIGEPLREWLRFPTHLSPLTPVRIPPQRPRSGQGGLLDRRKIPFFDQLVILFGRQGYGQGG